MNELVKNPVKMKGPTPCFNKRRLWIFYKDRKQPCHDVEQTNENFASWFYTKLVFFTKGKNYKKCTCLQGLFTLY